MTDSAFSPAYPGLAALIQAGLRRDGWEPDYGSALQWGTQAQSREAVEVNLERAPLVWEPLGTPWLSPNTPTLSVPEELVFLDGVVRMHTRLLFEAADRYGYSGLGTVVVGALRLKPGQSLSMEKALLVPRVRRCLLLPTDCALPAGETAFPGLPFAFEHVHYTPRPETVEEQAPEQALQQVLRATEKHYLEALLAQYETQQSEEHPVIFMVDGPLPRYSTPHAAQKMPVVGLVKTLHTRYLPPEQHRVLYALQAGQRSPLFRIGQKQISWYMCLANPQRLDSPLSGIVRLEVLSHQVQASIATVQALADRLCEILPALVLSRHEDPRSPQNILPIHTLERQLKMRMGHRALIQRAIDAYFHHHLQELV